MSLFIFPYVNNLPFEFQDLSPSTVFILLFDKHLLKLIVKLVPSCVSTMSNPDICCYSQCVHSPAQHQRLWRHHVQIGAWVAGLHQNEPVQRELRSRWDHDHGAGARLEEWVSAHMAQVRLYHAVADLSGTGPPFCGNRESIERSAWTFVIQFVNAEILHYASAHVIPLILCWHNCYSSGSQPYVSWHHLSCNKCVHLTWFQMLFNTITYIKQ